MDEEELTRQGKDACTQFLAAYGSIFAIEGEQTLIDKYGGHGSAGPDQYQCYAVSPAGTRLALCFEDTRGKNLYVAYLWVGMRPEESMAEFKQAVRPLEDISSRTGLATRYVEGREASFYNMMPVQIPGGKERTVVTLTGYAAPPGLDCAQGIRDAEQALADYVRARSP